MRSRPNAVLSGRRSRDEPRFCQGSRGSGREFSRPAGLSHRNLVTPEGLEAIEAALARFEQSHRQAIAGNDAQAAATAMREVRYWRARRASAEVIRPPAEADTASFGTTVMLRRDDGREQTFRIVGEDEADPRTAPFPTYHRSRGPS